MRHGVVSLGRLAVRFRLSLLEFGGLVAIVASVWFLWTPAAALLVGGVLAVFAAASLEWSQKKSPR